MKNLKTLIAVFAITIFASSCSKSDDAKTEPTPETPKIATVSTLAGSTSGFNNATGINAQFNYPTGIAVDVAGNLFVVDRNNYKIRKVTPNGVVTTFAGSTAGVEDGAGATAKFSMLSSIAIDGAGNLFVSDDLRVRKITPAGVVSTFAGSTAFGDVDGTGTDARFGNVAGIAINSNGVLYVCDAGNNKIKKITPTGVVSTFAGSTVGDEDGSAGNAKFSAPIGIAVDSQGNAFVSEAGNNKIKKITFNGTVTTIAGNGQGDAVGNGIEANFYLPAALAIDASGNIFISDFGNNKIKKMTPTAIVSIVAGSTYGYADGIGIAAQFKSPYGIAFNASGNLFVCDSENHMIRKITFN